jgi:hypothetical protein
VVGESTGQNTSNPVLGGLDALVGEREMQASVGGEPLPARARTVFDRWKEVLTRSARGLRSPTTLPPNGWRNHRSPPRSLSAWTIRQRRFTVLWADGRDVYRVYQMSLSDGVWKHWRDAPGLFQRFTGTFSDDGCTITARLGEVARWHEQRLDFDQVYTKVKLTIWAVSLRDLIPIMSDYSRESTLPGPVVGPGQKSGRYWDNAAGHAWPKARLFETWRSWLHPEILASKRPLTWAHALRRSEKREIAGPYGRDLPGLYRLKGHHPLGGGP